ncbi:hypothetical protein PSQ39_06575 [Curvibacter sp. HBC28]|uniref:Uncharacterized protein n=1 Tax=Curvibacter microcysteis TaxID=3026419 RepID=A0ABT5MGR9_9BURK|nr:hypothetical protein [Curvibacter sp. HBC28]MDD0814291.1 hypothetical protein [Curvibacter sp. HBC28]
MAVQTPPTLTDLPATPDRNVQGTFNARVVALFDTLKNTSVAEWRAMMANVYANAVEAYSQVSLATAQAQAAALSAQAAQTAQAAAQAVSDATQWVSGASYSAGNVVWSPSNGLNYRRKAGSGVSTTDPRDDPAVWFPTQRTGLPLGYITDTGGTMYGAANGGLGMLNVITYSGQCIKQLPQNPNDGDLVEVKVANGRRDNQIAVNAANPIPIDGITDAIVLDQTVSVTRLIYLAPLNRWSTL